MALQHVRSSTANKRPVATNLADGQLAINYNSDSPGVFLKDSNNGLVKIGPIHVGATAPNATPAGSAGNGKGEGWLDTSGANPVLKIWNGTAWANVGGTPVGNVVSTADTGTVTSTMIADGTIVNADINASAGITDGKLATISTANKVAATALDIDGATDIGAALADADLILVDDGGAGTNRKAAVTRITDYVFAKVSGDITISNAGAAAIGAGVIVNADINASAAIADTKLATISTAGKVANSATTATNLNTASAIVARDASGNFTAGTITAALTGNASTATTLATARSINGTSFNGSADITTASWGTSRTLTVGGTGKSVDGSGNVSWTLTEIGAPSTTGVGATGTWGISITGSSASCSGNAATVTNGVYTSGDQTISGVKTFSTGLVATGFRAAAQGGSEGGEIYLTKPPTGSTLAADVAIDLNGNSLRIFENGGTFRGLTVDLTACAAQATILHSSNYNSYSPTLTGTGASGTWGINITGSAGSVATLATARNINGTSFNGSADITTANWGTARTLTVGSTGKSVNGSANVSWSLAEIGALGASAKAVDSDLIDGIDSARLIYGSGGAGINTLNATQNVYELGQYKAGFWEVTGAAWTPNTDWWWGATFAHSSNTNAYNFSGQLIFQNGNGANGLYARTITNGTPTSWGLLLSSGNFNAYSPTLTGTGASGTWGISVTGNAATATAFQTPRTINGVSFNGTANITVTANTPSSVTFNNGGVGGASGSTFNGGGALTVSYNTVGAPSTTGTNATGTWAISVTGSSASCTGNAATATTLQSTRTINGTNFNGSANITTATWGTARTVTIGATGKSVDGSGAVSWTLAEIGAAAQSWVNDSFPSGTTMLFVQTTPPVGWTKSTTHDNKALRVVSGTASSGGTTGFDVVFASRTPEGTVSGTNSGGVVGGRAITVAQMPAHNHGVNDPGHTHTYTRRMTADTVASGARAVTNTDNTTGQVTSSSTTGITIQNNGSGQTHDHPFTNPTWQGTFTGTAMDFAVQYVDVIIAVKN